MKGQDLMINSTKEMLKVILQNVLDFSSVQVAELVYVLRLKILKTVFEKKISCLHLLTANTHAYKWQILKARFQKC
jgi:hypothetical protein